METENIRKFDIIGERPQDIPESWMIFNAPRPLYGHKEWQGEFEHGVFYVAVNPDEYGADGFIKENVRNDGWLAKYWSKEDAIAEAKRYLSEEYPGEEEMINRLNEKKLLNTFYSRPYR